MLALGIGLLVLLGVVAAASRAHHTPGGHAGIHQPPAGVGDYLFSIFAVLLVAMALFLLYLWFSSRDMLAEARRRKQGKRMYKAIFLLLLILGLAPVFRSRFHFFEREKPTQPAKVHPGARAKNTHRAASPHPPERAPTFEWLPVFIATGAGTAVLGYIGLRALRRTRADLGQKLLLERELESLLDDTLDDLYAERDPRRAIIAAYARMERLFEAYGVPRRPAEAPMEYLGRALGELSATGAALGRLTGLFQWAKFSSHDVDETMRGEAIGALTDVRDELRAKRLENELRRTEAARFEEARRLERKTEPADERTFGEDPFAAAEEKMKGSFEGRRGV